MKMLYKTRNMLDFSAVVIWYNPKKFKDDGAVKNILSYSNFCKTVYIIDNSDIDNSDLAKEIQNSVYVPNKKNLGIATALNQGCSLAKNGGFVWCMTMDQDSNFDKEQLEKYISLAETYSCEENIKSFTLMEKNIGKDIKPLIWYFKHYVFGEIKRKISKPKSEIIPDKQFVDRTITSANIINLISWEKVGKFDDQLFIDEVDHDFCIRLKLNKYDILKFNTCYFNHSLGEKKLTIFPKIQYESDFRLFYIFRNLFIENFRYGNLPFVKNYKKEIWYYFRDYCIFDIHAIIHLIIFFRAYKDYKRMTARGENI